MPEKYLLAKTERMYYPIHYSQPRQISRRSLCVLLLCLSLFLTSQTCYGETGESFAENYRLSGYAEQQQGHFQEALRYYTKALALGLNGAVIFNDIGVVYEQLEIGDKAEEFYLKAIERNPEYLAPYTNLAFFYQAQGKQALAIEYFQRRLELGSEDDPWQEKVRQELYKLDPEIRKKELRAEAKQLTQQVLAQAREEFSLQIQRAENRYLRGQQLLVEEDFDAAITEFKSALILTPGNPKIMKALDLADDQKTIAGIKRRTQQAIKKLEAGDVDGAKEEFQQILTIFPNELKQKPE